jgi:protein-S-isoprenylcysteine O-methyltransferase Ste14
MKGFRVARVASTGRHLATTLAQIVVFWGTFLFVLPALVAHASATFAIEALHAPAPRTCGGVLFVLASTIGLWSAYTMSVHGRGTPLPLATAREFVVVGPYRWLRNPMAFAGIAQGVGVALWRDDSWVMLYALAGSQAWHWLARPPEERDLLERFGERYARWRVMQPLWVPHGLPRGLERWLGRGMVALGALALGYAWLAPFHPWPTTAWATLTLLLGSALASARRDASVR